MDMQAKQLALQHMASYKDLNMYFNRNQKTTLEIINDTHQEGKMMGLKRRPNTMTLGFAI